MLGAAGEESLCTSGVAHTSTQMQSQTILSWKGSQGSSSPTQKCMACARLKPTTHPGIISTVLGLSDSCTASLASASQAGCTGDFMDTALSCPAAKPATAAGGTGAARTLQSWGHRPPPTVQHTQNAEKCYACFSNDILEYL